jgi:hypothetical protein
LSVAISIRGEKKMNIADRADAAEIAVASFADIVLLDAGQGFDRAETVQDLITDLGHYCDRHQVNFIALCAAAIAGYSGEKRHTDGWLQPAVTVAIDEVVVVNLEATQKDSKA